MGTSYPTWMFCITPTGARIYGYALTDDGLEMLSLLKENPILPNGGGREPYLRQVAAWLEEECRQANGDLDSLILCGAPDDLLLFSRDMGHLSNAMVIGEVHMDMKDADDDAILDAIRAVLARAGEKDEDVA